MSSKDRYSTWVEVDLDAVAANSRYFVQHSGASVMAVVKANAYGHGAVPVAEAALRGGATWFGVARPDEALELRQAGISHPILMLGFPPKQRIGELIGAQVSFTVWTAEQVAIAADVAARAGELARLHLKLDSGMGRLGVQDEGAVGVARVLNDTAGVVWEGFFSHFARADEREAATTDQQAGVVRQVLAELRRAGMHPGLVHVANSAAALTREADHYDLLRVGIALYGLHPSQDCPLPAAFKPALTWKSQLAHIKTLPPGRGVSYGHEYCTQGEERIGTIPVGYADGYRRTPGAHVLIHGVKAPVVGRVCMDYCMVQLDGIPQAAIGDEVVLIGRQGGEMISAENLATEWGTINYEVTCGISMRVPRFNKSTKQRTA